MRLETHSYSPKSMHAVTTTHTYYVNSISSFGKNIWAVESSRSLVTIPFKKHPYHLKSMYALQKEDGLLVNVLFKTNPYHLKSMYALWKGDGLLVNVLFKTHPYHLKSMYTLWKEDGLLVTILFRKNPYHSKSKYVKYDYFAEGMHTFCKVCIGRRRLFSF